MVADMLLLSMIAAIIAGQLAFGYTLHARDGGVQLSRSSLVRLLASTILALLLSFIAEVIYAFGFIDCCYGGTTLNTALAKWFLYDVLSKVNPLLLATSLFGLGLLGYYLARVGKIAITITILTFMIGIVGGGLTLFSIAASTLTLVVPEAPDVPLYPGAQNTLLDKESFSWFNWHDIQFQAPVTAQTLKAFYREELPKRGWTLLHESSSDPTISFVRAAGSQTAPWKYHLLIWPYGAGIGASNIIVNMHATRYPDLDRFPVYPQAQDISRSSEPSVSNISAARGIADTRIHTISYFTLASPETVIGWYRDTMGDYGWWSEEGGANEGTEEDLTSMEHQAHFSYEVVKSPHGDKVVNLTITATLGIVGEQTKVDVRAVSLSVP